ncbi:Glutaminyl-tRNA synthetase, non-specific RNA binding region part 1 [Rhizoctonia solani]|uniref:glutamine--tRNA ligase n=1 Tax=Rhizoctonia solani TaxID=456999 RepID=A0A8H7ILM1_9AGAM|nr:Glutaminyl-tRNA synthetase, non-specific RNA binding region part 1 [Rhizoctonia solani]
MAISRAYSKFFTIDRFGWWALHVQRLLGRLASQGMVVIALEHRDGSGPSVMPTDEETGKPIPKLYFQNDDISWEEQPKGKLPLRVEQLKFRIREIYESYESFKHIVQGNRGDTVSMDNFSDWDSFKDQVDFSKILLTGHSFGGATSVCPVYLNRSPPEGHNQLPIDKVVLLDPWMDPLPLPGTLPVAYETRPPLLIMNSEGFTLWKEHFEVLQQVVSDWRKSGGDECASLVTIVRSQHHYYSDFGAFMPFGKARELGLLVLDIAHKLTMAYNNGSLASELKGKRSMEIKPIPEAGALVTSLSTQGAKLGPAEKTYAVDAIVDRRLKSGGTAFWYAKHGVTIASRLIIDAAAIKYLSNHPVPVDDAEFNKECGVGIEFSLSDIAERVNAYMSSKAPASWSALSGAIGDLKSAELRWASPLDVKNAVEKAFTDLFGSKEEAKAKASKEAKKPAAPAAAASTSKGESAPASSAAPERVVFEEGFLKALHKPGDNPQISPKLRDQHLEATGGNVFTRFPPEPNGFLHIGHSKAIFVNFGYAAHHNGKCYLRYDDTNPKPKRRYTLRVYWKPCAGLESLAEFENMKNGKYKPGEAILRMKQDLEDGNPQMWDLIAYRTLNAPHHRTGTKWCIYPTYDFTHCLVDSFENISHSLCTTEFILSRVSYEWLCDAVEVYKPRQSEYGRLNLQGTIMSKRKLLKLVTKGYTWCSSGCHLSFVGNLGVSTATTNIELVKFEQTVRQYLENTVPRLLMVLRPLKVTIENLADDYVQFIDKPLHPKVPSLGSSRIPFTKHVYIDAEDFRTEDSKDYFRLAPNKTVGLFQAPHPITCVSYKTDASGAVTELVCRLEDGSDGKPVPKPKAWIQWVAEHAPSASPVVIDETRIFHSLFKSDNPAATDDFLADINPNSLDVIKGAMVEVGFWPLAKQSMSDALKESRERTEKALKEESVGEGVGSGAAGHNDTPMPTAEQLVGNEVVRFQGLRVAYFALDKESRLGCFSEPDGATPGRREGDKLVLNRIVSLKEDAGKKAV